MPIRTEQPTLPMALGIRQLGKRAGKRFLALVREVCREGGKQEAIAATIGISPELFSQALNGQRAFHVEWLPAILVFDHQHKILGYLAWQASCRIEPLELLTPEKKYPQLIAELRRSGADVEALERRAYFRPEDETFAEDDS